MHSHSEVGFTAFQWDLILGKCSYSHMTCKTSNVSLPEEFIFTYGYNMHGFIQGREWACFEYIVQFCQTNVLALYNVGWMGNCIL